MPTKVPCSWCANNKAREDAGKKPLLKYRLHGTISAHCQYCGQPVGDETAYGGGWYKGTYYEGHVRCVFEAVGTQGELYFRRVASGEVPEAEQFTHDPEGEEEGRR